MEDSVEKDSVTLSDRLRVLIKGVLDPIAAFFNRLGVKPNTITLFGLIGHGAAAFLLATGRITWGGILILIIVPLDALDGTMARLRGHPTKFGAFIDSVTDRFAEIVIFGGLLLYYLQEQNQVSIILVYLSIAGSIMVSYTRARAEALGFSVKIGILSRFERYLILIPALILNYPIVALWILAIMTNITALQRIIYVRRNYQREHGQLRE
ncbi:MAG: CDP-alcohol phosphatidyltransferase family protein [Anaerolineaceae bacterium]|nr:CDP-alcohol phosphatidyltransferase family protein [Anaerolineaceae bacterium]